MELKKAKVDFVSEFHKDIFYDGVCLGSRRLDLLVENKILVELKARVEIDNLVYHLIINYLKIFDMEVGLLLNFGQGSLGFKRFINSKPI